MSEPILILTEEDCQRDTRERLHRNVEVRGRWGCDGCGQRFEEFYPHVHGDVKGQFGYMEAFCSEGCAIIRYSEEGEHA